MRVSVRLSGIIAFVVMCMMIVVAVQVAMAGRVMLMFENLRVMRRPKQGGQYSEKQYGKTENQAGHFNAERCAHAPRDRIG